MSKRSRQRNRGRRQRTGTVNLAPAPTPPREPSASVSPSSSPEPVEAEALPATAPPAVSWAADYAYVKRDMVWMLATSIVLFSAMALARWWL